MAFVTFPSSGPYSPTSLMEDLNENFGKTVETVIATPNDGEFLLYDGSSATWINATFTEAGVELSELSNVSLSTLSDGEALIYDGSSNTWINGTVEAGASAIGDLTDVSIATPSDGEVLTYDGSSNSWINAAASGGSTTLDGLTDVSLSTLADGEVLTYDSSSNSWLNGTASAGTTQGAMELIGVYDLSVNTLDSGNEIDIDVSNYAEITGTAYGVTFGTSSSIGLRVSDDGGSSFYSTTGNYRYSYIRFDNEALLTNFDRIVLAETGTSGADCNFELKNLNTSGATVVSQSVTPLVNATLWSTYVDATTSPVNSLRFFSTAGHAATGGTLVLWGMRSIDAVPKTKTETVTTIAGGETAIDFTGIPSDAEDITLTFNNLSLSGTDNLLIQLGDSGGFEISGYTSSYIVNNDANSSAGGTSSSGFVTRFGDAARDVIGRITLEEIDSNQWVCEGSTRVDANNAQVNHGTKTLSATLDRIRLTPTGSDTFDAGKVKLSYRTAN